MAIIFKLRQAWLSYFLAIFAANKIPKTQKTMKKIILTLAFLLPIAVSAQKTDIPKKYAAGTVPVVDGSVVFSKDYTVNNKTSEQIYDSLLAYAEALTKSENALPQSRIFTNDKTNNLLVVNMEEWMYFKKKAWVTDRTRFYYQLLYQVRDGGFTVTMRNIHYLYEEERDINGGFQYDAETWITDDVALVKNGTKLSRLSGKFRTFTIDRKDELFSQSNVAAGGKRTKKVRRIIYEDEGE